MLSAKLAYRNLPRRKARTSLTVIAVVLGVALLVGISLATASAMGEFTSYINKFWGQTDIIVRYTGFFNSRNISLVQNVSGVRDAAPRINWYGSLDNKTVFQMVGVNGTDFDFASLNITGTKLLSQGRAVVGNTLAEKFGLSIGSTINIFTLTPDPPPLTRNATITATVIGIDHPLRNIGAAAYVYLPDLQSALGVGQRITQILARIQDPTEAVQVRNGVQSALGELFDVGAPKAEAVQRIQGQMAGFQLGLNVMIAVALVVCSFIVFNTLFMSVNERTYEIGVMRAVGTSRWQVFRIFLSEGLLIGLLGAGIGILAGFGLSRFFTFVLETYYGVPSLPETTLTVDTAVTGLAAGFGAVLGGGLYPAVSASRTDIIRAIRPRARDRERRVPDSVVGFVSAGMLGVGALHAYRLTPFHISYLDVLLVPLGLVVLGAVIYARAGQVLSKPFSPMSEAVAYVASRSGRRRLVRNAVSFGMITVTLSFAIMLGGIHAGVQSALEQGIQEALGADIIVVANQSIPISFVRNLTSFPEVAKATPLGPSFVPAKAFGPVGNASIGVLAVDPAEFPNLIAYNFVNSPPSDQLYPKLAASNETLLMPDGLASRLGVLAGDTLKITTFRGSLTEFTVAGVFTGPVLQYVRFGENFASESIIVSFRAQQRYFAGRFEAPVYLVDLKPEAKPRAVAIAHDIAALYPRYDLAENSLTLSELLGLVRTTIDRIFAVILSILYFALLIASLGIAATMIMNVTDRRREIGLLRSQGMSAGQVAGLFLGEGITLGVFGFLLALPGGLLLLRGATNSTSIAGFWLPFIIPWSAIGQSFLLAILAVILGSIFPAIHASRTEITQALEQV